MLNSGMVKDAGGMFLAGIFRVDLQESAAGMVKPVMVKTGSGETVLVKPAHDRGDDCWQAATTT